MGILKNFNYQIAGNPQGHKLVFLHGLMGSAANWMKIAPAFHADFHVLTYDQRGHGRSFHPSDGYTPRDYAMDLMHILDELGWNSSALVGHSMGGRNALEFAGLFSQRVKALVLEDIGPDASFTAMERILKMLELVPVPFASRAQAKEFFTTEYPELIRFYPQPQVVSRFFLSNIETKPDGSLNWRFDAQGIVASLRAGRNEDRWDSFANLKMPVMVVRGQNSADLPPPVYLKMLAINPRAEGVEIPDAGHWVHFDRPEAFIRVLKQFFQQTFGTNL
jgi:esterase